MRRAAEVKSLQVILVGDAAGFSPWADVPRLPVTMDEFERRASEVAGVTVRKQSPGFPRGQCVCELRPMIADMYPEAVQQLPWWGWGEWDCVWGDWDSYLTEERLDAFDMISSSGYTVNGCLTLWRNNEYTRRLYLKQQDALRVPTPIYHMDELGAQIVVTSEAAAGRIRCLYPNGMDTHDRHELWPCCTVRDGKLYRMEVGGKVGRELLNFHFQATNRWPLEL